MRLLNVKTEKLEEFNDGAAPPYTILSHTWGEEEVTFKELTEKGHTFEELMKKAPGRTTGYDKIYGCCRQASMDSYDYVWIDTCCIDKSSSAELSEAINSMFKWYSSASVCYVYLSDVPSHEKFSASDSAFKKSRWFRRGWTLQELLAPRDIMFFDMAWQPIVDPGLRPFWSTHDRIPGEAGLVELISEITGIRSAFIAKSSGRVNIHDVSIAERMSWAADRKTTRPEDAAYCLLGIFDVNMPTIYGEGTKAFTRLQEEIIRQSSDHSIFAWNYGISPLSNVHTFIPYDQRKHGLLASSPAKFKYGSVIQTYEDFDSAILSHYAMTNRGMQMDLMLWQPIPDMPFIYAVLNCAISGEPAQEYTPLNHSSSDRSIDTKKVLMLCLFIKKQKRRRDPLSRLVLQRPDCIYPQLVDLDCIKSQLQTRTVYLENQYNPLDIEMPWIIESHDFLIHSPIETLKEELILCDAFPIAGYREESRSLTHVYLFPYNSSTSLFPYLFLFSSKDIRILVAVIMSQMNSRLIALRWDGGPNLMELVASYSFGTLLEKDCRSLPLPSGHLTFELGTPRVGGRMIPISANFRPWDETPLH